MFQDLKNKTAITATNKNKTKLEACSNKNYIEQMQKKLSNNFKINLPGDIEMLSISELQARHDNLFQQKITLEEINKKKNCKMKQLDKILNNFQADTPLI